MLGLCCSENRGSQAVRGRMVPAASVPSHQALSGQASLACCTAASVPGTVGCFSLSIPGFYCSTSGKAGAERRGAAFPRSPAGQEPGTEQGVSHIPVLCRSSLPRCAGLCRQKVSLQPCPRRPCLSLSVPVSFRPRPATAEEPSVTTPPLCPPPLASASESCGLRPLLPPTRPPPSASSPSGAPTFSR